MKKEKRSRLVWDDVSEDWKPRWGYNSIKSSQAKQENWMVEVKGNGMGESELNRVKAEKKLHVARQKMREVRNKVESFGGKMRATAPDLVNAKMRGKDGLREAMRRAQASSASFGKFDRVAPNEPTNLQPKRKRTLHQSVGQEKERYLKAADRVFSGDSNVNSQKAAKAGKRMNAEGAAAVPRQKKAMPKRRSKQGGKKKGGGK